MNETDAPPLALRLPSFELPPVPDLRAASSRSSTTTAPPIALEASLVPTAGESRQQAPAPFPRPRLGRGGAAA